MGGVRLVLFHVEQGLHDVAQGWDVPEPDADTRLGRWLGEDGLSSSFRVRVGSAASWFPACPVSTEHILVARHSASHSCTVLSVRSTISAMMPTSTPREAYRIASAFIRTSTWLSERFFHLIRTAVSSKVTSTCMPRSYPKRHRESTKNTVSFHVSHSPVANAFRIYSPFIEIIYDVLEFR